MKDASHFFKKGIALLLLIFAGLTTHANPSRMEAPYSKGKTSSSAADCTYTFSPANKTVPAEAGRGELTVTTGANCTWTVAVDAAAGWITITSDANGIGAGMAAYSYKANMSPEQRTGTLTIGAQT